MLFRSDSAGNAYVTGFTASTQATFPVIGGPDLTSNGFNDAFVAKVNVAGTALVYCGFIGGSNDDEGKGIAVDSAGNAYVSGFTASTEATFPVTVGPDLTSNGLDDAFVAKVNAAGTALVYCGYIGGSNVDQGSAIALDSSGNAYVTGFTASTQATFPVIAGPDLTYNGGGVDAFVVKIVDCSTKARGDVNGDGTPNVQDVFYLINSIFAGGPAPPCSGDVNGDGLTNGSDIFYLINFLFAGGPPPPP